MIDIKEQVFTEELKKRIYKGFSRHAIAMTDHDEKFDAVAFVAMEDTMLAGAIVVEHFGSWENLREWI